MASNTQEFISRSTFKKLSLQYKEQEEENRDAKNWIELPTDGTIFKIINVDKKNNGVYGETFLLTIIDKFGEESKVCGLIFSSPPIVSLLLFLIT